MLCVWDSDCWIRVYNFQSITELNDVYLPISSFYPRWTWISTEVKAIKNTVRHTNPTAIRWEHISTLCAHTDLPLISRTLCNITCPTLKFPFITSVPGYSPRVALGHIVNDGSGMQLKTTLALFSHKISWNIPLHTYEFGHCSYIYWLNTQGIDTWLCEFEEHHPYSFSVWKEICWHVTFPYLGIYRIIES